MKLLNSFGPNPRMVRMFISEKGIELESLEHDLMGERTASPLIPTRIRVGRCRLWNLMTAWF